MCRKKKINWSETALQVASKLGREKVVNELIVHGATLPDGLNRLQYVRKMGLGNLALQYQFEQVIECLMVQRKHFREINDCFFLIVG